MTVHVECLCPLTPGGEVRHPTGDNIELKVPLDFRSAATMQHSINVLRLTRGDDVQLPIEEILGVLTESYLRFGIRSWTLVDPAGKPIPVTPTTVDMYLMPNLTAAALVGDEADAVFSEVILLPLVKRASTSSPDTPTTDSTSAPTGSPIEAPTPLRPSSTSTIPTDDIDTTSPSPDGDSSSSRSSESVA